MSESKKRRVDRYVEVGEVGSDVRKFALEEAKTVSDVLEMAGLDFNKETDVRVNNEQVELDHVVQNGDIVTVVGHDITGG